jgi:hypothetical protein
MISRDKFGNGNQGTMNYRILSLDGGGTWALIQVKALIALYNNDPATTGHKVLQDFDLAAANSGGSIVLGELLEDRQLGDILKFFEDEAARKSIFSPTQSFGDRVLHALLGLGPKYSAKDKLAGLQKALPKKGLTPLTTVANGLRRTGSSEDLHVLITSFDYDRNRARFFRSSETNHPGWGNGEASNVALAEAIHASTNAPVNYFDAPAIVAPGRCWDGGIAGCNNPVLAAVTEAIGRGQRPTDIVALSIGTASVALLPPQPGQPSSPFVQPVINPGIRNDVRKLATSIVDDPPDIASFLAHIMTGIGDGLNKPADSRIVRMNPLISPVKDSGGTWSAPGSMTTKQFTDLVNLDFDAVEQSQVDAISKYADLWLRDIAHNQPIRMNGETLAAELGQDAFSSAAAAWKAIK